MQPRLAVTGTLCPSVAVLQAHSQATLGYAEQLQDQVFDTLKGGVQAGHRHRHLVTDRHSHTNQIIEDRGCNSLVAAVSRGHLQQIANQSRWFNTWSRLVNTLTSFLRLQEGQGAGRPAGRYIMRLVIEHANAHTAQQQCAWLGLQCVSWA